MYLDDRIMIILWTKAYVKTNLDLVPFRNEILDSLSKRKAGYGVSPFLGGVTKCTSEGCILYHGRVVSQGFHFIAPQTVETCAIGALLQSEMPSRDNSPP